MLRFNKDWQQVGKQLTITSTKLTNTNSKLATSLQTINRSWQAFTTSLQTINKQQVYKNN